MPSAALTIAAVGCRSIDHPTTLRDHASSTTQYTLSSRVGCSVMSVIQELVGPVAVEVAVYEVLPSEPPRAVRSAAPAFRQTADGEFLHDRLHELLVHALPVSILEFRADATPPIGATRP